MIPISWSPRAQHDLERISAFNEARSHAWAEKVRHRIFERVDSLSQLPQQGRPVAAGVRVLSLIDVQYVVTYHVTDTLITVLRVHHTRENREDA